MRRLYAQPDTPTSFPRLSPLHPATDRLLPAGERHVRKEAEIGLTADDSRKHLA
jgi:hypothetical protein